VPLLCECGNNGSEEKYQDACAEKCNGVFHAYASF
jgi:hypothetical protein